MSRTHSSQSSASSALRQAQCEEVCGQRPGDRRVRVQRPPRSVGRKMSALVRRVLADR